MNEMNVFLPISLSIHLYCVAASVRAIGLAQLWSLAFLRLVQPANQKQNRDNNDTEKKKKKKTITEIRTTATIGWAKILNVQVLPK